MANVRLSKLELVDGKPVETNVKTVNPFSCPHFILMGEHYREDGSCKCNDPKETIMREWGYKWSRKHKQWSV